MNTYLLLASSAGNFAQHLADKVMSMGKSVETINAIFITTAANLYQEKPWMDKDIQDFEDVGFKIQQVDIHTLSESDVKTIISDCEVCIVGGGNTVYLLEEMLEKNMIKLLNDRVNEGMIYVGSSPGAVIAGPDVTMERQLDDRDNPPQLASYAALNLVDVHILPHWNDEQSNAEYLNKMAVPLQQQDTFLTLTDDQAVEVVDRKLKVINLTSLNHFLKLH